jgi:outer membrane protein
MWKIILVAFVAGLMGATLGISSVRALPSAARIGYVTVPSVIQATPAGSALKKVEAARGTETKPITDTLKVLQPKMRAGSATFEERDQWDALNKKYATIAKKYDVQFQKIVQPFDKKLLTAIKKSADSQGFSLIVDGIIATDSGLLLYANQDAANITKDVITQFKKMK